MPRVERVHARDIDLIPMVRLPLKTASSQRMTGIWIVFVVSVYLNAQHPFICRR